MSLYSELPSVIEPLWPMAEDVSDEDITGSSTPASGMASPVPILGSEPDDVTAMPGFRRHTIENDDNISMIAAGSEASMGTSAWEGDSTNDSADTKAEEMSAGDQAVLDHAKKLISHFQSPKGIVRIIIPSGVSYLVHIDLLAAKSSYFRAALTGNLPEAQPKELTLKDVSDTTFTYFLQWLYTQSLRPTDCQYDTGSVSFDRSLSWPSLINLWFFANHTRTPELQNHIVDNLVAKMRSFDIPHSLISCAESIRQVRTAIFMIWRGKKRSPQGELAKPLRDLILAFIGNRHYMMKKSLLFIRLGGFPEMFWRDFGLRCIDLNYTTVETIQRIRATEINDDIDDDEMWDAYDDNTSQKEAEKVIHAWEIRPETYYVKEAGKTGKDAKKDPLTE